MEIFWIKRNFMKVTMKVRHPFIYLLNMYYLYWCLCTSAKCMSVELKQFEKVYLFIWSHDFWFSMSLSLSPNCQLHRRWRFNEGSLYIFSNAYTLHIVFSKDEEYGGNGNVFASKMSLIWFGFMVLNATVNNISVI